MAQWHPVSPEEALALLAGLDVPWWLAGGWALDRHLGRQTRAHGDLDVAVLRCHVDAVRRQLVDWDVHLADPPGRLRRWVVGEPVPARAHDVWCRRTPDEPWAFQLMLEESDGDEWVYRRDARIRRPLSDLGDGVLVPEVQLLYKVDSGTPKDLADVSLVLPSLSPKARGWLDRALAIRRTRLPEAGNAGH